MALCRFSENTTLFEITPVENLFILEFMLRAPGDYVKVYLYGLMLCKSSDASQEGLTGFARALDMETDQVRAAFEYWQRQGVVKQLSEDPLQYVYYNIASRMMEQEHQAARDVYKYQEFNEEVQRLFGSRLLTAQDYQKIYDWIEVFGLQQDAVLLLIEHYTLHSRRKQQLSLQTLEKHVREWVEQGVRTLSDAKSHVERLDMLSSGTSQLLRHLSIHRLPTVDESQLYRKWTGDYGFTHDQIMDASKELTKIREPNLNYLDRVLFRMYETKEQTGSMDAVYEQEQWQPQVKQALFALGKPGTPTPAHIEMYRRWQQSLGFSAEAIELACAQCVLRGHSSFEAVEAQLNNWKEQGVVGPADIKTYLEQQNMLRQDIYTILDRAGLDRAPNKADAAFVRKWTQEWNMNIELVYLCAEYARHRDNPMVYMNRILESWRQKGIETLSAARSEHEAIAAQRPAENAPKSGKKQLHGLAYTQRTYDPDEFNALVDDTAELAGE